MSKQSSSSSSNLQSTRSLHIYAQLGSLSSTVTHGWLRTPSPSTAAETVTPQGKAHLLSALRSLRGIDEDRTRTFLEYYMLTGRGGVDLISSQPLDAMKPVKYDLSPSGNLSVSFHNQFFGVNGKEDKIIIDVNNTKGGVMGNESYRLDVTNVHGPFLGDAWFSGLSWSPNEEWLAYVACVRAEKSQTHFSSYMRSPCDATSNTHSNKFDYREDWGETFTGVGELGLYVLHLRSKRIFRVPCIDKDLWTVGQPCFISSEDSSTYTLVYTAWSNLPRKLGLLHCFQRPSSLFVVDLTSLLSGVHSTDDHTPATVALRHVRLTEGISTARSPRCSTYRSGRGSRLVFLGSSGGFKVHNGCSELFSADAADVVAALDGRREGVSIRRLVPEVVSASPDERPDDCIAFPGIYTARLCDRCFVERGDSVLLVMSSQWGSRLEMITVDVDTGEVMRIDNSGADASSAIHTLARGSCTVLHVLGTEILYEYSSPSCPPQLSVLELLGETQQRRHVAARQQSIAVWRCSRTGVPENIPLDCSSPVSLSASGQLDGLRWQVQQHREGGIPFESILLYPSDVLSNPRSVPIIVVPHGGPHSAVSTSFVLAYAFLCIHLRAAVLHVNYRGSPGFGQGSVLSLPGQISTNDVADVMTALHSTFDLTIDSSREALSLDTRLCRLVDQQKVSIVGGSHGGFIAGHCIGQHPGVFKVAAMRNPVTNIPAMVACSDIAGSYLMSGTHRAPRCSYSISITR